jgi:hypothetical protein
MKKFCSLFGMTLHFRFDSKTSITFRTAVCFIAVHSNKVIFQAVKCGQIMLIAKIKFTFLHWTVILAITIVLQLL